MTLPIEIFYHLYIPPDWKSCLWAQFLDRYVNNLQCSRLYDLATINLCITMPKFWTEIPGIQFTKHDDHQQILTFENKIREYINLRYPKINVLEIRDINEQNLYEGQTLRFIHQRAHQVNAYFLYTHSKGMHNYHPAAATDNWLEILDYFIINQWSSNIKHLETHDVVGVRDAVSRDLVMSGNFWWSKTEHIQKLPDPIKSELYWFQDPDIGKREFERRYAFERWVMSNSPQYYYAIDTKTNHYTDYCFLENLI